MRAQIFAVAVAALAALSGVLAAGADVYTVRGVDVDAVAETASAARDVAIAQGQAEAAQQLIARMTLPEDAAAIGALDRSTVDVLVAGFQVDAERVSANRYLGTLSVSFVPAQVRGFLRSRSVPFVETQARPVLLVPLWAPEGQSPTAWSSNPWTEAWRRADFSHHVAPLLAPTGDLEDLLAADDARIARLDGPALAALAERYGAARVLVAVARPRAAGGASARVMEVDTAGGGARELGAYGAADLDALVEAVAAPEQDGWKRRAIVRSDVTSELRVTVLFGSLAEWRRLQDAIGRASLVNDARLESLTVDGAVMALQHRGDRAQLAAVLAERRVMLIDDPRLGVVARAADSGFGASPSALGLRE